MLKILPIVLGALALSGCSVARSRNQNLTVYTNPAGAGVYVNGEYAGKAPVTVSVPRNRDCAVVARDGDATGMRNVGHHFSATGWLDAAGGIFFVVPVIGCFTPGAWELDSETVFVPVEGKP